MAKRRRKRWGESDDGVGNYTVAGRVNFRRSCRLLSSLNVVTSLGSCCPNRLAVTFWYSGRVVGGSW